MRHMDLSLLRISIGIDWIVHAFLKIYRGMYTHEALLAKNGITPLLAWPTFGLEVIGGVAILLGWYTRQWAAFLLIFLAVVVWIKWPVGWGYSKPGGGWEYPMLWLVAQASLVIGRQRRLRVAGFEVRFLNVRKNGSSDGDRRRSGRRCARQLTDNQPGQRFDRLKIFRRDLGLRDGEIKLGLDGEHQIDHVHRRQTDIHQQGCRLEIGGNRVLLEDGFDESEQPALDIANGLHVRFLTCRGDFDIACRKASHDGRDYNYETILRTVNPV